MGSSTSNRVKLPTVRLSNAITGSTFQQPQARLQSVDPIREDRPSQVYLQAKIEPQCQDASDLKLQEEASEHQDQKEAEEGINFFFSPIPDLDGEYNQLINEILLSQRKKKLADPTPQPEQEESRMERKRIEKVQSSQIEHLFRRIKTIKSIIERSTSPDPNQQLNISQHHESVKRGISPHRISEQLNLDELDRLVFSNTNIAPITDLQ